MQSGPYIVCYCMLLDCSIALSGSPQTLPNGVKEAREEEEIQTLASLECQTLPKEMQWRRKNLRLHSSARHLVWNETSACTEEHSASYLENLALLTKLYK